MMFETAVLPAAATESPIVIWVLGSLGVIAIVAGVFRRESDSWGTWLANRRRAAVNSDDARVADQAADIQYLKQAVNVLRSELEDRDALARAHHPWDHQMIMRLLRHEPHANIPEPPPLVPVKALPWPEQPKHRETKEAEEDERTAEPG